MISLIGHGSLIAAVVACGVAVAASLTGAHPDRRQRIEVGARALTAAAAFLAVALGALAWAMLTGDYTLEYVARATSRSMSWPYRLGSLWSGMEGSLLLWCWLLAMGTIAGVGSLRRTETAAEATRAAQPIAAAKTRPSTAADTQLNEILGAKRPESGRFAPHCGASLRAGVQALSAALVGAATLAILTLADPFARLAFPALDGAGLTPILEHPALLYHPPILYAGQTLLAVPFAVTVVALLRGQLDDVWLAVSRRFTLVAWVALSAGMAAGAHWAYRELGWGGLWAWDPVENASLLPWLAATAFLHSVMVVERRRRLQAQAAGFALAAFALALTGAYLSRSGATGSVHAFAEARAIGVAFLAGTAAVVLGGGLLLGRRWRRLGSGWAPDGIASREAALLANNVVLVAALVVVTAGTLAPLVSDLLGGEEFTVAPRFFASLTALPALVALALAGIGSSLPLSRWRVVTAAVGAGVGALVTVILGLVTPILFVAAVAAGMTVALSIRQAVRSPRRSRALAAALAHLGFALALFGIAGSTAGAEISGPVGPGQQVTLGRYRLVHEGLIERQGERRSSVRMQLGVFVGDDRVGTLRPGLDTYHGPGGSGAPLPETALRSTPREDLLVTVVRIDMDRGVAVVEVFRRPLVLWVWLGGLLIVLGGALALRRPATRRLTLPEQESAMMVG